MHYGRAHTTLILWGDNRPSINGHSKERIGQCVLRTVVSIPPVRNKARKSSSYNAARFELPLPFPRTSWTGAKAPSKNAVPGRYRLLHA